MIINLAMHFDDETYFDGVDETLTEDQKIQMMKEDFMDTITKQWTPEEVYEALSVEGD